MELSLKEIREEIGAKQKEFSEMLGISINTYRPYEYGTRKTPLDIKKLVQKLYKEYKESLVATNFNAQTEDYRVKESFELYKESKVDEQSIPLYDVEASLGLVQIFDSISNLTPKDYIRVPGLGKCDGAIYGKGDSMYPLVKSGDIVAYKIINDIANDLFWGQMYLLDIDLSGDNMFTSKYIQKSEKGDNYVKLVSENRHHQDKHILISRLRNVALIKAIIRIN